VKALVLVLAARMAPYPALVKTIERTWASREVEDVAVLFYFGGMELREAKRKVYLPVPDDLGGLGEKTLAAFRHVLDTRDFDVVFRTNCSSYVDLPNLRAYLLAHGRDRGFYAGHVGEHDGLRFASGSGYFLSRDLVELVVKAQSAWDHAVLDDVALGALLAGEGYAVEAAPRQNCGSRRAVADADLSQFHFRCKTSSWRRLEDARIMVGLFRAFARARGQRTPRRLRILR
jgi:hypothetical protein